MQTYRRLQSSFYCYCPVNYCNMKKLNTAPHPGHIRCLGTTLSACWLGMYHHVPLALVNLPKGFLNQTLNYNLVTFSLHLRPKKYTDPTSSQCSADPVQLEPYIETGGKCQSVTDMNIVLCSTFWSMAPICTHNGQAQAQGDHAKTYLLESKSSRKLNAYGFLNLQRTLWTRRSFTRLQY